MWSHQGVYGLCVINNSLLVLRKERGPYAGLFCLPGGKHNEADSYESTLEHKFLEELGAFPTICSDWKNFSFEVFEDSQGNPIHFHHCGVCCRVDISGDILQKLLVHYAQFSQSASGVYTESGRLAFLLPLENILNRQDISPLVRNTLAFFPELLPT